MAPSALFNSFGSFFDDRWIQDAFTELERGLSRMDFSSSFPPHNLSTTSDGTLILELAVAGYDEDSISVTAEDGKIAVKSQKKSAQKSDSDVVQNPASDGTELQTTQSRDVVKGTKNGDDGRVMLYKGIRSSQFAFTCPIPTRFDLTKAVASMKGGILSISIPLAEERKPKSIKIL